MFYFQYFSIRYMINFIIVKRNIYLIYYHIFIYLSTLLFLVFPPIGWVIHFLFSIYTAILKLTTQDPNTNIARKRNWISTITCFTGNYTSFTRIYRMLQNSSLIFQVIVWRVEVNKEWAFSKHNILNFKEYIWLGPW